MECTLVDAVAALWQHPIHFAVGLAEGWDKREELFVLAAVVVADDHKVVFVAAEEALDAAVAVAADENSLGTLKWRVL